VCEGAQDTADEAGADPLADAQAPGGYWANLMEFD